MKTGILILCIVLSEVVYSQDHATIKIGASTSNRDFVDLVAAMDYDENYFRYTSKPVETHLLSLGIGSRFIERFTCLFRSKCTTLSDTKCTTQSGESVPLDSVTILRSIPRKVYHFIKLFR
jgi:hypothetical protein